MNRTVRRIGWFLWFKVKEVAIGVAVLAVLYAAAFCVGNGAIGLLGLSGIARQEESFIRFGFVPLCGFTVLVLVAYMCLPVIYWMKDNWKEAGERVDRP